TASRWRESVGRPARRFNAPPMAVGAGSAAAVRTREDLQVMAGRVVEVDAPATVVVVDLALAAMRRIGPVVGPAGLDPAEDLVELRLGHEEGVVLDLDVLVGLEERERDLVGDIDVEERTERPGRLQAEDLDEELRGFTLVARVHDGVVQLDRHSPA